MSTSLTARIAWTALLAALCAAGALLLGGGSANAATGTIRIGSATMAPASQSDVALQALNVTEPGLGAWSIDISYDPTVVTPVACAPQSGSVCNPNFDSDTIRVSGANATGLDGDSTLAVITFGCADAEASTALTLNPTEFADATIGDPQPIDTTVVNGSISCQGAVSATETVAAGDGSARPGESDTVDVEALNIGAPGLGAWTVDISYDTSVATAVSCTASFGGVCNEEFESGVVRITGATIDAPTGDVLLGTITFQCPNAEGETALAVSVQVLVDSTLGAPQPIAAATQDGTFTCSEEPPPGEEPTPTPTPGAAGLPPAGSGTPGAWHPGDLQGWLIAGLAGAGLAWLVAGLAGNLSSAAAARGAAPDAPQRREPAGFVPRMTPRGKPGRDIDRPRR
jgi:hypothetical protein